MIYHSYFSRNCTVVVPLGFLQMEASQQTGALKTFFPGKSIGMLWSLFGVDIKWREPEVEL